MNNTNADADALTLNAHEACIANYEDLENSEFCGCFYCLSIYSPSDIREWIEDDAGDTAICPHCGIDAVIAEKSGLPLSEAFLQKMNDYWF